MSSGQASFKSLRYINYLDQKFMVSSTLFGCAKGKAHKIRSYRLGFEVRLQVLCKGEGYDLEWQEIHILQRGHERI